MRRNLFHLTLALLLVPMTVAIVLKRLPAPPESILAVAKPTHRVAVAVDEAMRAELASVARGNFTTTPHRIVLAPNNKRPTIDTFVIPEDDPAAWIVFGQNSPAPTLMTVVEMQFDGTTRDGRAVHVTIKGDPIGEGSLVDCHGDEGLARALAPRIADRLAHPTHKHESPEDRAALMAFFGPNSAAGAAPVGKVDPAVRQAGGVDVDESDEDQ